MAGFMLRSLIHLDLSFVHGDRYESICILLHVDIQLCQHHFLEMLSFFHCIILFSLLKIRCSYVWINIGVFNLIPLVLLFVFVPIPSCFHGCNSITKLDVSHVFDLSHSDWCKMISPEVPLLYRIVLIPSFLICLVVYYYSTSAHSCEGKMPLETWHTVDGCLLVQEERKTVSKG